MPPDGVPGEPRGVWVQLLKKSMDWLMARESGGTVSLLQPEVWGSRQKYRGIVGVAVDDIAGGGEEVWEQAISKLKQRFTFGHWEVEKGEILQSRGGAGSRWIHACWAASLHQEPRLCAPWETEKGTIGRCQIV